MSPTESARAERGLKTAPMGLSFTATFDCFTHREDFQSRGPRSGARSRSALVLRVLVEVPLGWGSYITLENWRRFGDRLANR